jgi:hypothetical protein
MTATADVWVVLFVILALVVWLAVELPLMLWPRAELGPPHPTGSRRVALTGPQANAIVQAWVDDLEQGKRPPADLIPLYATLATFAGARRVFVWVTPQEVNALRFWLHTSNRSALMKEMEASFASQ